MKKINIGSIIERRINKLGLSKSEFGRRIGVPQQHVNRILEKESIDTDKLITISEALGYNFFLEYLDADVAGTVTTTMSGNGNQWNGHGAHGNVNGSDTALLEERIKRLEEVLVEKERLIKLYERIVEK
jgi:transcriptional regulator with XRE-family HTH domain